MADWTEIEAGYRAYQKAGLTATCPYPERTTASTRWWHGYNKAWNEDVASRRATPTKDTPQ